MKKTLKIFTLAVLFGLFFLMSGNKAFAATAEEIKITKIDYGTLTISIDTAGNNICYYSKDKSKWYELEYIRDTNGNLLMDISWVSSTSDVKLYFKGDKNEKVVTVTIPKKNSALKCKFNAADGTVEFDETDDATEFQWKKSTDTVWTTVSLNENSTSYKNFISGLEALRFKGSKIYVRTPYKNGTGANDTGARASKEITVSISKRSAAPSVSVNLNKLTLNTNDTQEYSLDGGNTWKDCDKTMKISEILEGRTSGSVKIRKAATERAGYSRATTIVIPERAAAPTGVGFYYENKMTVIQINDASSSNQYEYATVKAGDAFDETSASWKGIISNRPVKINKNTAPVGSTIYVRKKGKAANASKGTALELPSKYTQFAVTQ